MVGLSKTYDIAFERVVNFTALTGLLGSNFVVVKRKKATYFSLL
tara:strand:+ start:930 stop:1061 length:132 start_codon:yes stop_codon:yes gene_type:complete